MVKRNPDGGIVLDAKTLVGLIVFAVGVGGGGTALGIGGGAAEKNTVQDQRLDDHARRLNLNDEYHARMDERWLTVLQKLSAIEQAMKNMER